MKKKNYKDQEFIDKVRKRILEICEEKNIGQEVLSERTGFDLRQVGRILRGETNTSISNIAQISRAIGVHPKELFNFEFSIPKEFIPPIEKENKQGRK
ncbi:helix-turn-helix domain-containing protein [Nafulsella turpanensis]|uniref:helix-turn-helix domain-containing protein n=1 Tax=Nafulsella turpanensis TaxID=1265690 RepID=UPI00034982FA|nr:helix-turn-helix transcriptional regulator [Nafulsella turpanensis]